MKIYWPTVKEAIKSSAALEKEIERLQNLLAKAIAMRPEYEKLITQAQEREKQGLPSGYSDDN